VPFPGAEWIVNVPPVATAAYSKKGIPRPTFLVVLEV